MVWFDEHIRIASFAQESYYVQLINAIVDKLFGDSYVKQIIASSNSDTRMIFISIVIVEKRFCESKCFNSF